MRVFQLLLAKSSCRHWVMCPPKFEIFLIFFNFLSLFFFSCVGMKTHPAAKLPWASLRSFGISWGNAYTKFAILDIKFPFTCGKSYLYLNIVKFQNIMTRIVAEIRKEGSCWFYSKIIDGKNVFLKQSCLKFKECMLAACLVWYASLRVGISSLK